MANTELSFGIIIGIVLSLVVSFAKEIIIGEYNTIKDNSLRIKNIRQDLKADIMALWDFA